MIAAGTAAAPTETRHGDASLAPTSVASTIPTPMPSWKVRTSRPRLRAGASSATYIGTTWVAPPTAKPSTIRASDRVVALGATEQSRVPTTNTADTMMIVLRRPRRSESWLQVNAPSTAPKRMLAAITCSIPLPVWKSRRICSSAPEMMPVS